MRGGGAHGRPHDVLDLGLATLAALGDEPDVALDGDPDHHVQPVTPRRVEEPERRHGVGAHGVEAGRRHQCEIALDDVGGGHLAAVRLWTKRAVGDAADVELLIPDEQELATHARRRSGSSGRGSRRVRCRCNLRDFEYLPPQGAVERSSKQIHRQFMISD